MKKFSYSLESVLRVKRQMEEGTKLQLSQAIRRLRKEEEYLRQLILRQIHYREKKEQYARHGVEAPTLMLYDTYLRKLGEMIEERKERVASANRRVEELREELVKIMRDCETLEKLRDKKYREYKKEMTRTEQKVMDELAARIR